MKYFATLDTNVLVSALLGKGSIPGKILDEAISGCIVPLYADEIIAEYQDVLRRKKFPFTEQQVKAVTDAIICRGLSVEAGPVSHTIMPDPDDVVFYAVVMEKRKDANAYLVTGNQKHFPREPFIVTPKEMLDIIEMGESIS